MTEDEAELPRGIGTPATRALTAAGYTSLHQLDGVPARQIENLHGVGPKALRVLREALAERGMSPRLSLWRSGAARPSQEPVGAVRGTTTEQNRDHE